MALRDAKIFYWTGTTDTVATTSTNWQITPLTGGTKGAADASDYPGWDNSEGGGTNVDGDIIILDAAVTNGLSTAAAWDQTAKGKLAGFIVTSAYNKGIGKDTTDRVTLDFNAAGDETRIDATAAGNIWLAGTLNTCQVTGCNSSYTVNLSATITTLNLLKANVALTGAVTTLNIGYETDIKNDVTLTIADAATIPTAITMTGGTVTNNDTESITVLTISGGTWIQAVEATISSVYLSGGTFRWDDGTLTNVFASGGTVDATKTAVPRVCTTLYHYNAATVDLRDTARNVRITNYYAMCEQPKLYLVPGQYVLNLGTTGV